ncbi:hypothetical protein WME91_34675 [Sorangium sp. So ce269]
MCAASSTALGCNAIWGIPEGKPLGEPAPTGAGGDGGTGPAGGSGGNGAAGGAPSACPFEPFSGRAPDACQAADSDHNYLSDPENCCVPGRSCLGGACEDGKCKPFVLATPPEGHEAIGIAVEGDGDGARVLWGSGFGNTVFATDKVGGSTEPLAVLSSLATMLARSGSSLFVSDWNSSDVLRVPLEGNITVPTVASAEGYARQSQPVAGHGWVYWVTELPQQDDQGPDSPAAPHRIWAARADEIDQTGLSVLDSEAYVGGLALDATHLYWTEMKLDGTEISVRRMALGEPSEPETVVAMQVEDEWPGDITVGDRVYWNAGADIYAVNKDGSGSGLFAAADYPAWILADSTFIYWYSDGADQLRRVRISGGAPEALADSPQAWALAQDCSAIYWTTGIDETPSAVLKVAK